MGRKSQTARRLFGGAEGDSVFSLAGDVFRK